MVEILSNPDTWLALITLTTLEIVLGIDNLVMIAILVSALPAKHQNLTRRLGIGFALLTRVILLFMISWLAGLKEPIFHISTHPVSIRDLVMFAGGFFLVFKGIQELYSLTKAEEHTTNRKLKNSIPMVVMQIGFFDIVFSLDSVITAVAMSNYLPVMVTAIVIAMAVMLFASGPVVKIINTYISIKVLALSFLLIVGVMLILSGLQKEIPKGYLYTAMAFSALVEFFVIFINKKRAQKKGGNPPAN